MRNLQKQVGKCIRCPAGSGWPAARPGFVRFAPWLACLLLASLALAASPSHAQTTVTLSEHTPTLDISAASVMWIDPLGEAGIEEIAGGLRNKLFVPSRTATIYRLGHTEALWQHYRLTRGPGSQEDWVLDIPQPLLDQATLYQRNNAGGWSREIAGDTIPVADWPEPGRYVQFKLLLDEPGVHDVFLRIRNVTQTSLPVRVSTESVQAQRLQMEYVLSGVVFGALLLLSVACASQGWVYKDPVYAWYALYALMLTLVVAAWTGVAGHVVWRHAGVWNDLAPGFLGLLAGGAALLVIHKLCGIGSRHKWFETFVSWLGFAALPVAIAFALVDRRFGIPFLAIYLASVVVVGLLRAWMTWRRRDVIGLWAFVAFLPMALATLMLVSSRVGFVPSSWFSQYGLLMGLTVEVPLLLIALNMRSRERHSMEARSHALVSQDALTGLLAAHIFRDRLKQIVARARRHDEPAAIVYIELVNYRYIKKNWGTAVAEQSLLRSVIKLRRILRDVDTVGRVDESRFGLILEGESSRAPVTEMAARLIAAGLMPLKGLKPEVVLQFHVAAVLLNERMGDDTEIEKALTELIQHMGPRSRRPIRFLEPLVTRPAALDGDSSPESLNLPETAPPVSMPPISVSPLPAAGS